MSASKRRSQKLARARYVAAYMERLGLHPLRCPLCGSLTCNHWAKP